MMARLSVRSKGRGDGRRAKDAGNAPPVRRRRCREAVRVRGQSDLHKAALNRVAEDPDLGIANRHAWEQGLKSLPNADRARNVVLPDAKVLEIIAEAYRESAAFGLFVELNAATGARPDQIRRLNVNDLRAEGSEPRLTIPPSKKGKSGIRKEAFPVPISTDLAKRLAALARDRAPNAPLLTRPDGGRWQKADHDRRFNAVIARRGLADWQRLGYPDKVTIYALRHSDIVRRINANEPLRVIAATHDTSVAMIERHYAKYIASHTDAISRAAMLDTSKLFSGGQITPSGAAMT